MVIDLYSGLLVTPLVELVTNEPNKIVFITKNEKTTSSNLLNNSQLIALNLLKQNFKENDIVVMAIEPGKHFIEIIYALLMLRAKIAIIDPEMGSDNYASKIKQLSPQWIFADSRLLFINNWPLLKKVIHYLKNNIPNIDFNNSSAIIKVGINLPVFKKHINFNKLLYPTKDTFNLINSKVSYDNIIVYTSGTLDIPKGVLHSDKSLSTTINLLRQIIAADKNDIVGTYLPHFMLLGIASGLVIKIMPTKMTAKEKLTWLEKEKINVLFGPPSEQLPLVLYCENTNTIFPETVKHLMLGSAPVHQGFLKRLVKVINSKTKITCTYGMTEHLLVSIADGRDKINYEGEGDLLGKILNEVDVKINDDKEIIVKSNQIFSRYFHMEHREEWHSTGDLGMKDKNGNLILLGRKKEMIIRKDFNLYPALYEGTIKKIPEINEAAFVGIYNDDILDEKVYLAIETDKEDLNEIEKLLIKGKYSIDRQALPDVIFKMKIPRKGRQDKIDRAAIVNYIKHKNL